MGNIRNMRGIDLNTDKKADDMADRAAASEKEDIKEETIAESGPATLTGEPTTVELKPKEDKSPRASKLRAELKEEEAKLEAELRPHREYHDRHVNDAKYLEARKKIKEISKKLAGVKNELAALARSSGTNTAIKAETGTIGTKG